MSVPGLVAFGHDHGYEGGGGGAGGGEGGGGEGGGMGGGEGGGEGEGDDEFPSDNCLSLPMTVPDAGMVNASASSCCTSLTPSILSCKKYFPLPSLASWNVPLFIFADDAKNSSPGIAAAAPL